MIDISRPIRAGMAVWPGDTELSLTQSAWGSVTVGAVALSLHTGTHADAPSHFLPGGASIEQIQPEIYVGECVVIDGRGREFLDRDLFESVELAPRVLIRTDSWRDGDPFPDAVPTLTKSAIEWLEWNDVILIGVDVPSVDALDSKNLPIHHALAKAGIHILESLDLRQVTAGRYTLSALPLPFALGDASPVRAVLW
jgi:arylformamidase